MRRLVSYADAVDRRVALGLQREPDGNGVRMGAEQVLPNGVPAAVAPWGGPGFGDSAPATLCGAFT